MGVVGHCMNLNEVSVGVLLCLHESITSGEGGRGEGISYSQYQLLPCWINIHNCL